MKSRFLSLLIVKATLHESNQATNCTANKGCDPANKHLTPFLFLHLHPLVCDVQ